jgi:uncharacterized membrane protein (DUF373 family)
MIPVVTQFKRLIYSLLLILLGSVILASVLDLTYIIIASLFDSPLPLLENKEVLSIFSLFLLVLIGIEFFETILAYLHSNVIHVEIIIMVAVIAVARKIIILDTTETSDLHLIGLGILMLSLGAAYFLVRHSNRFYPLNTDESS